MRRLLAASLLAGAMVTASAGFAQEAANRITAITVDDAGNVVLSVEGDGVDPLVRLETAPNHQYRIVILGKGAAVNPALLSETAAFSARLAQSIPAVASAQVSTDVQNPDQFQVVLTSWQKLQPQVKSNTGSRIVIALIGDHRLPAVILAQRQHEAALKHQAEVQKQAAAEAVRKAELLKQQAEALKQKAAALKKQQADELKRKQEEQAALKEKQAQEAQQKRQQAIKAAAEIKRQQAEAARQKAMQQAQRANNTRLSNVSASQLQSDWTPAYRPEQTAVSDGPLAQLQLATGVPHPVTPRMLAQDKLPPTSQPADELDAPAEPIRLSAPPPDVTQNSELPGFTLNQTSGSPRETASLYALSDDAHANPALRKAWQDVSNGNPTNAELSLRNYLEKSPDDCAARYLLGEILLRPVTEDVSINHTAEVTARRDAARQEFLKIVSKQPYLPAYLALMDLYLDDENLQAAVPLWASVSVRYPNNAQVLFRKGRLQESLNSPDAARQSYRQALTSDPNLVEAHWRLAQVELSANRLDAARWELDQALTLAPTDGRLWKLLGFVAEKQNEPRNAGLFYRAALQPDALINYGRSLEAQNEPDKALTIYKAAETLAGDDIDLLFNLGMLYANLRQNARAEVVLGRFLDLNKDTTDNRILQAKTTLKQLSHKGNSRNGGLQPKILPF